MLELYNSIRWDDFQNKYQLYALTSASASAGMTGAQGDFFAAALSNLVYPSVSYAYFTGQANVQLNDATHGLQLDASATGMASIFTKLFQFTDNNNDGEFTADVDTIVDEYPFWEFGLLGYADPKPVWARGAFDSGAKTAKIQTEDGVFALTLKSNEQVGSSPGGAPLTPMNTKVDVEINYANLQPGNKVGLETYVVSTRAEASAVASIGRGFFVQQKDDLGELSFTWDTEADVLGQIGDGKVSVKASAAASASLSDLQNSAFIKSSIGSDASLEVSRIVFAFDTSNAQHVLWDPTIGVGSQQDFVGFLSSASGRSDWAIAFVTAAAFLMTLW